MLREYEKCNEVSNHKQSLRKTGGGGAVQTLGTITEKVADVIMKKPLKQIASPLNQ
jgi:hypothetical protein